MKNNELQAAAVAFTRADVMFSFYDRLDTKDLREWFTKHLEFENRSVLEVMV